MSGAIIGGALIGGAGSLIAANQNADAQQAAAEMQQELPPWAEPFVLGSGPQPSYITDPYMTNSNWLDYILSLGEGNYDAEWQPMSEANLLFHPENQFTPTAPTPEMPFGGLPEGMPDRTGPVAPPPEQPPQGLAGVGYDPNAPRVDQYGVDQYGNLNPFGIRREDEAYARPEFRPF